MAGSSLRQEAARTPPGRAGLAAGRRVRRLLCAVPIAMAAAMAMLPGPAAAQPAGDPPTAMRRLTETQYRHAVADIFGTDIQVAGRMACRPPT